MECGLMVGDLAITTYSKDIPERYRGLTCRIVVVDDYDGYVRVVFEEDPNGEYGRTYMVHTKILTRLCGDELDHEDISEFLNDM